MPYFHHCCITSPGVNEPYAYRRLTHREAPGCQGGTSFVDLLCFCSVLCLLCLCARLFICALWSTAGKGLTSWLSFVVSTVSLSLSHWYPGSGVVLDCIDSCSLHPYLLSLTAKRETRPWYSPSQYPKLLPRQ